MRLLAALATLLFATAAQAVSPITFADPDGQELILEELSARTAIHGMLSLTELELRFRNPRAARIEGRFTATLPADAAISRFAKDVNGQLMEGEVVERLRANQVYEQFLHQMRDPALLEQDQGNRFSARIFPIEPNAPVRLILSYTQLLPLRGGVRTYTLPLRGLPKVSRFSFRAVTAPLPGERKTGELTTSTAEVTTLDEHDWTPDRDIVMNWRATEGGARILRAGDFYIASLRPPVAPTGNQQLPTNWLFYIDTSASAAEGAAPRIRALEALLAALPPGDSVELLAFDNEVVPLAKGTARDVARTIGDRLRARLFLGGTDVEAMLRDLSSRLASRTAVIVSDLVPTLGRTASSDIQSAANALPRNARVHALILGSREDAPVARALTAGRGRVVRVPFTATPDIRELQRPLGAEVEVSDRGAEWLYPARVNDVAAGDEVLILGKVRAGEEIRIAPGAMAQRLDSNFAPLLEREAYRAYLQYLAEREASEESEGVRRALAAEQVKISVDHRVVIPRTTMLVLENEFEYQRFGLARNALADILTIDAGGITKVDRSNVRLPMTARVETMPVERDAAGQDFIAEAIQETVPVPPPMPALAPVPVPEPAMPRAPQEVLGAAAQEAITVTAESPALPESSAVMDDGARRAPMPRERRALEEKRRDTSWTRVTKPSRSRIAELERQFREDPANRELYNQLGETLAALEEWAALRALAIRWQPFDPENPQVYELLGMAARDDAEAARAYASLIELGPAKTELLQRAGLLLLRANRAKLAEAPLRKALEARPDRANGYRHLALLLWQGGRHGEAARVLESATKQQFPDWYRDVQRVIREELGYVYRAWQKAAPSRREEIAERAHRYEVDLARTDALRITLVWETDANDVDLHVVDPSGEEVSYRNVKAKSGLRLYEDITQGLGPEVVRTGKLSPGTYHVGVRYFAAGPMGISRGIVLVMRGDERVEVHPFRLTIGGGDIRYVTAVTAKHR
jgi:tetratricopeptide (TPR) repeat protein